MKNYDVIVIGSGAGMNVADEVSAHGMKVAVVDKGLLGGTCLNVGCIPSKMIIFPADRIVEIEEARKLGIEAEIKTIDFKSIMERMRESIKEDQDSIREGITQNENLAFYEGEGYFVDDYTLEVNGERIKGKAIIIASGSRPFVPPIKGLDGVDYLTNETALKLEERPDSLIIIGGGYIGVEFGHFFAAMGTKVTIIEMADRLVLSEEPEIADLLQKQLGQRMEIYTSAPAEEIKMDEKGMATVVFQDGDTGKRREITAQRLMMAVGRRSNADLLKVENTGVETDKRGYIKVNEYLETSKENIFAIGDANGQQMFRHIANKEAELAADNIFHEAGLKIDYTAAPHAVYSHPQIASVGLTEADAKKEHAILVGRAKYFEVAKGQAMMETESFAKAIVDKDSYKILGFHIIGPYAPMLIQEIINAMESGGHLEEIGHGVHIHPSLSELIQVTLSNLEES